MTSREQHKTATIRSLHTVGRYAVGVTWSDGHDSILPLENLRRHCPCRTCRGEVEGELGEQARQMRQFTRLGEQSVFIGWSDAHETIFTLPELRALCRCAYCVGEPEKPITG